MVLVVWENWGDYVCRQLSNFLLGAALTDVTISVGDDSIKAHRIILSFFSPFFKKMLNDVNEQQPVVIVFPDINFRALQIVVAYMYQGQVNVPAEILSHVTELAKILRVKGLIKLPTCIDSVLTEEEEVKVVDEQETELDVIEDHLDFESEMEGLVELEVSTADGKPIVSSNLQVMDSQTAVTIITNTSCSSPKDGSKLHVQDDRQQITIPRISVTSNLDMHKNDANSCEDHILIQSEDIDMSEVEELSPTHIVKLNEDGSMSEVLFSGNYMNDEKSLDEEVDSKTSQLLDDGTKHSTKSKRDSLYKLSKYGPDDLMKALQDLRAGKGPLRVIAEKYGIPRSTLSVSSRMAGIPSFQKNVDYDSSALIEAKEAVKAGWSYMKAAKEFNIPKSVLWRKCQKDGILKKESPHYYTYTQEELILAKEMLCSGQSLADIVKQIKIPKTTLFRLKEQLVREGKMPASCISRIFRSKKQCESQLHQAVVACKEEGLSISQASEKMQVPKTTVWRRLKKLKAKSFDNTHTTESETPTSHKKIAKAESPEQPDLVLNRYSSYEIDETLNKSNPMLSRKGVEVRTVESVPIDSCESQTVIMENEEHFLRTDGTVIHGGTPLRIKQECLVESEETAVVETADSPSSHFQLEMPLVNFPAGGYQVVGSEIVIGGQHMVVLDSSGTSQNPDDDEGSHIVVAPFAELEVENEDETSVQSPNISQKSSVFNSVSETLRVSRSTPQDITVCLQSMKSESNSNDRQKTPSDERMSELITKFISVD